MKGKNQKKIPSKLRICNCISTYKKGIYEQFMMETKRGIVYHMQAFDDNSLEFIDYNYFKIVGGSS